MIRRLFFRILGWRIFKHGDVWIYQRNVLVDQTEIVTALDATAGERLFCEDSRLSVFVDDQRFEGIHGAQAGAELVRFKGKKPAACLRLSPEAVTFTTLVEMLGGLRRVT